MQALGGAVALVVGAYVLVSSGIDSHSSTSTGVTTIQDSFITIDGSSFTNCSAVAFTVGFASGSLGASSVYWAANNEKIGTDRRNLRNV